MGDGWTHKDKALAVGASALVILAVAALWVAVTGATGSYVTTVTGFVLDVLLAGVVVVAFALTLIFGGPWVLDRAAGTVDKIRERPESLSLIPAITVLMSSLMTGASDTFLADDPVLRWALTALGAIFGIAAALASFAGTESVKWPGVIGLGALAAPAVVLAVAAFATPWWSAFQDQPVRNQALIAGGVAAYVTGLVVSIVAMVLRRRTERHTVDTSDALSDVARTEDVPAPAPTRRRALRRRRQMSS